MRVRTNNVTPQSDVLDTLLQLRDEAASALDPASVPVYLFINKRFAATRDVTSDYVFQFLFRSFYRLDNAGLGDDFKVAYFHLLHSQQDDRRLDLRQLCRALAKQRNKKGQQSLQFSFATKLLATVEQERPIYDSFVAKVFGFTPPYQGMGFRKRLDKFLDFYELLAVTSKWLTRQPRFATVKAAFAKAHKQWCNVPLMKQVDFVLWATGKAMKNATAVTRAAVKARKRFP